MDCPSEKLRNLFEANGPIDCKEPLDKSLKAERNGAAQKKDQIPPVMSTNQANDPAPYADVYLYRHHPGTYVKKKSLWVKDVKEIRGERLNEFGDWEFYLKGDQMEQWDWVPLERICAQEQIQEFRKKQAELEKKTKICYDPLPFDEFTCRDTRILVRTQPTEIMYGFTTSKGHKFYVVQDEQERRVIMPQKDVQEGYPTLYREYLSRVFGFEIK